MEGFADGSGLFAVSGHREAAHLTYLGLHALQHRGGAGVGVATSDGDLLRSWRGAGRVSEALDGTVLRQISGTSACGMVWGPARAAGGSPAEALEARRMVFGRYEGGQLAAAVSGRFTNGDALRSGLQGAGALFHTESDAEVLLHLVAQSSKTTFVNRLIEALWEVKGAWSAIVITEDRVVAARDPRGFRPLVLGRIGEAWAVATEDAAIDFAGGVPLRQVAPGEIVILEGTEEQAVRPFSPMPGRACVHEWVSLAREDGEAFGVDTHVVRSALGAQLARERPCPTAQVVVALPGAEAQALAFANVAKRKVGSGLLREPFAPLYLEAPTSGLSDFGTRSQLRAVANVVRGQRVCLVAASVARGNAIAKVIARLLATGASEVHLRVASPWIRRGCRYGVASPTDDELFAPDMSLPDAGGLGARTVGFLSLEALREGVRAARGDAMGLCDACFSGEFPIPPELPDHQLKLF